MLTTLLTALFIILAGVQVIGFFIYFFPDKRRTTNFSPPLSIIIPAHNESKYIASTIKSILSGDYRNKKEILVIDDGSIDNTAAIVKKLSEKNNSVRLFSIPHSGKAAAINYGVEKAAHDILVYLDADSDLGNNSLRELVSPLSDKNIAASTGTIRVRYTRNLLTWMQDIDYIVSSGWRYISNKIGATYVIPGVAAFRKKTLEKIGKFSSDTLSEDIDIVIRLKKIGYNTVMVPSAVIYASVPTTLKGLIRQRFRWGRGSFQVAKKHSDIFFSKKTRFLGLYSFPMHLFWYAFALVYLPIAGYAFISSIDIFVTEAIVSNVIIFGKWFTIYGIADILFWTVSGSYALSPLILSIIVSWLVSFVFFVLLVRKFSQYGIKTALSYAIIFVYYWILFFIQAGALIYELSSGRKGNNVWNKYAGN